MAAIRKDHRRDPCGLPSLLPGVHLVPCGLPSLVPSVQALKKICDHPGLLKDGAIDEIKDALEGMEDKGNLADIQKHMEKILNNPEVMPTLPPASSASFSGLPIRGLERAFHRPCL